MTPVGFYRAIPSAEAQERYLFRYVVDTNYTVTERDCVFLILMGLDPSQRARLIMGHLD